MTKHVKPYIVRISRDGDTEKLYRLEHQRNEAIQAAARELAKVVGVTEGRDFWPRVMPQALFDLLESFEIGASYVAAKAYVEYCEQVHPDMVKEESD